MKSKRKWLCGSFMFLAGLALVAMAQTKPPEAAAPGPAVPSWAMKMRIFEVPGKGAGEPAKAITSSYLNYSLTATIKTEFDLAEEMKQIQKTFNYQDVKLLTEADFSWKRNERDKQFHIFRLDGLEYLILITPVDVLRKLTFRIEVFEQGEKAKINLLDTEFSIPERNITVFGFEDTKGNTYFLSFRVTGWKQAAYLPGLGTEATPYIIPAEGPVRVIGEIKPPRLLKQFNPRYPEIARQARVEGLVIVEAETDVSGHVQNVKILRSIPLLDQAAIDAVRQWIYEPLMIDGKPRGAIFTCTVRFQLDGGAGKILPPAKDGEPLKLTGDVKGPKLITLVHPVYPPVARQSGIEGTVILEVTTDITGHVANAKILRSIPLLDQAAVDAVKQWVFEPTVINGKPISLTFTTTVRFVLDGGKPRPMGGVMGGVIGGGAGEEAKVVVTSPNYGKIVGEVSGVIGQIYWERDDVKIPGAKDEPKPVKIEGDLKPPKLLKKVDLVYPEIARTSGVEGTVVLQAETDTAGKVKRIKVLRSNTERTQLTEISQLHKAAIDAVRQWEYEPLIVEGKARGAIFNVTVTFTLK